MSIRNYPLVNTEGIPIPIDILEPIDALDPIDITTTPMAAPVAIADYTIRFIEVWSNVDCIIGFTSSAVDGSSVKGIYHLRADDPRLLILPDGYISGITWEESGKLFVNIHNLWEATKKAYQTTTTE